MRWFWDGVLGRLREEFQEEKTYPRPVRRLPILFIIVSDFVEIILV